MNTSNFTNEYTMMPETPSLYSQKKVTEFIDQEVRRPSKQWITNIIAGDQESEQVILRTDQYVLLPDTERVNRYWRTQDSATTPHTRTQTAVVPTGVAHTRATGKSTPGGRVSPRTLAGFYSRNNSQKKTLNWLSILHDMRVRTMRDLRGQHVPMLKEMLTDCMSAIEKHTGIPRDKVMAYVHYPPSVYQLHVHFSYPYGQYCHRDAYRVHPLHTIINNLEIDSDYYAKATLHLAMYKQSPHYLALVDPATETPDEEKKTHDLSHA